MMRQHLKKTTVQRLALVLVLVLCMGLFSGCMEESNYKQGVKYWNKCSFDAAMYYFSRIPDYKDAGEYVETFESAVLEQLCANPWGCGREPLEDMDHDDESLRWSYEFHPDGQVMRRVQFWEYGEGLKSYRDEWSTYELIYDDTDGYYRAYVRIGGKDGLDYNLVFAATDDPSYIKILGFQGNMTISQKLLSANMSSTYYKNTEFFQNFSPDSPMDAEPFQ